MDAAESPALRDSLLNRRERLVETISEVGAGDDLVRLLREVDAALKRFDTQTFGRCEACHQEVDDHLLHAHPLIEYCLCRLTPEQQDALQQDLDLATRLQFALLPAQDLRFDGWTTHFRYLPAGPVSGDYIDLVASDRGGGMYFFVGDVSGKGVSGAFVMARLGALLRGQIDFALPLPDLVGRANRLLAENNLPSQYATLICGHATPDGEMEICNAGHHPALVVRGGEVEPIDATGYPVGLFNQNPYRVTSLHLEANDALVLFTDGLIEARDPSGREYGLERFAAFLRKNHAAPPRALVAACLADIDAHRSGVPLHDDLSLLVLRRSP